MVIIKEFYRFIKHIIRSKDLLTTLIKNDFKKQYLGSYLGLAWAFIQPIMFMLVIWFVFDVGFRSRTLEENVPFFLWLICGMVPWFFFANVLNQGTNSIVNNSFLVKKVVFRVSILPIVQIGSIIIIHFGLLVFLTFVLTMYGFYPNIYWLQLPYYLLCMIILLLGLTWITSSIRVFIKDVGNIIAVILQMGFWMTPIFWTIDLVPEKYQYLIQLNPMYYITNGYRETFIYGVWFWEHENLSLYFLVFSFITLVLGAIIFKRLRPHFGDVL